MKVLVTLAEMNFLLVGAEHGYKACEKGKNIQAALASIHDHFEIKKPEFASGLSDLKPGE